VDKFSELIQAVEWILRLRLGGGRGLIKGFLRFRIAILFGFGTVDFMSGPMLLLTLDSAVINFFAPCASQKLFIGFVACLTLLKHFCLGWLLSWEV
jgi:hypothetical protein